MAEFWSKRLTYFLTKTESIWTASDLVSNKIIFWNFHSRSGSGSYIHLIMNSCYLESFAYFVGYKRYRLPHIPAMGLEWIWEGSSLCWMDGHWLHWIFGRKLCHSMITGTCFSFCKFPKIISLWCLFSLSLMFEFPEIVTPVIPCYPFPPLSGTKF